MSSFNLGVPFFSWCTGRFQWLVLTHLSRKPSLEPDKVTWVPRQSSKVNSGNPFLSWRESSKSKSWHQYPASTVPALVPTATRWSWCWYQHHFTDKEAEARRAAHTYTWSGRSRQDLNSILNDPKVPPVYLYIYNLLLLSSSVHLSWGKSLTFSEVPFPHLKGRGESHPHGAGWERQCTEEEFVS